MQGKVYFSLTNSTSQDELFHPKASAGEIVINKPEDKSYAKPDLGYYPGTYGFEEDEIGDEGLEIEFVDAYEADYDAKTTIISELDGHKNVMDLWDGDQLNAYTAVSNNFSANQVTGKIEFWTRVTTVASFQRMHWKVFGNNGDAIHLALNRDSGGTLYYDDGTYHPICTLSANTWYRFNISFDALSNWHLEVRDEDLNFVGGDGGSGYGYKNSTAYFSSMKFNTAMGDDAHGFHIYLDAIGYSWEENYNIGDNKEEGMLLNFNINFSPEWIGYSLDGSSNKTILGNTTIPVPTDGQHYIQVFGNDSYGSMHASEGRYFETNTYPVDINIISPANNELLNGIAPNFEIFIGDLDLNSTWYSLDGITNIPFSGFTGVIDQTEWDKFSNGTVTIGFYANDSVNNISHKSITVRKDVLAPIITINSPQFGTVFSDLSPLYNISIDEVNLDSYWYSFDGGATNYSISELSGATSESAWDALPNGHVTLTFYALDKAGNIGQKSIIITKQVETPAPPAIPGYNVYFLIGLLSIAALILIKARKHKI